MPEDVFPIGYGPSLKPLRFIETGGFRCHRFTYSNVE